ncbi:ABC transporter substrate-binding protein [Bordetella genomosp. 8]|uniref:ABC transporter substrate-binding protein n=1 Tax=Bordetella genomosp. 8 TaxID=1416806 RepID=A0A1W6YP47_9BORD|nr:ABC transporter substrate-binding protein [Bordetella genomosp. 8]ARP82886.1 ABC transporter substrate-binding protein [Bordetella genomosp. 8]
MGRISRRAIVTGVAAAAGVAAVARVMPGRGATGQEQARRVLVIATANDINNLDPHTNADEPTTFLLRNVYDALVRVEADPPRIVPQLARAWEVSADGLEYVFRLNPAARFSDGSPVSAHAVAYSIERLLRIRKGNAWMIAGIIEPGGVQPVDATTVRMRLARPFGPLLQVLPWIWIVNPAQVEPNKGNDDGQTWLRAHLAGSGPFQLRRAESGNLYELRRTATDWRDESGNATGVILKVVRESASQRLMVQRGDAHIAVNLSNDDIAALQGRSRVNLVVKPELRTFMFRMNTKHGPLADVALRKAVSWAVDYQAMLDVAVYARPAYGPLPQAMFGFDKSLPPRAMNLERAHEYMARIDTRGQPLALRAAYISGYEQQRRWCLVLLDSLKKLGITLDVRAMTWPDLVASARRPETCPDFFSMFTSVNYADPADVSFNHYHSSRVGNWSNPTYANPAVDALIERGRSELDPARRNEIYIEFQRRVLDDSPDLFISTDVRKLAFRRSVQGFTYTPIRPGAFDLAPLSLEPADSAQARDA